MPSEPAAVAGVLPSVLGGFDLTDHARFSRGFPYDVFARLRREAPRLFHPPGQTADGEGFWVLSRHADIKSAAAGSVFSARGGGGRVGGGSHLDDLELGVYAGVFLAMMDNPRHNLFRSLLSPMLTGPGAAAFETGLRADAAAVVDAAIARGACEFATDVTERYALLAVGLLLGVPRADREHIVRWGHQVVGFADRRTGRHDDNAHKVFVTIQNYARDLLTAKRADPGRDAGTALALDCLPKAVAPLSDHERELNLMMLMLSGGEQPRNTIAGGVHALARNPAQWRALREDRSLVAGAVEEMLRWTPPNPYNRRTATKDVELGGTRIQAGDKVTLWWPSANRDEAVFAEPDTFDIRRTPNPHLAFGHGTHSCLGNEVARLEIRVLLEELLDRVAEIQLTGPVSWAPNNKHSVLLNMPVELISA